MSARATDMSCHGSRWSRLLFDVDEKSYELWEVKFLGHLRLQRLKDTILTEPTTGDAAELLEDEKRNAKTYAELIQFLGD